MHRHRVMDNADQRTVLQGRYSLGTCLTQEGESPQLWVGTDEHTGREHLVKIWVLPEDFDPSGITIQRTLWDAELRAQRRIASLPEAKDSLVVLHTAELDKERKQLVMVLDAEGYTPLAHALRERGVARRWLHPAQDAGPRAKLWQGLKRVARGLMLLHSQNILHCALTAESVFLNDADKERSFRLGGFDRLVHFGQPAPFEPIQRQGQSGGSTTSAELSFRADWAAFGRLCAQLILDIDPLRTADFHQEVTRQFGNKGWLLGLERDLIARLTAPNTKQRTSSGDLVLTGLIDIIDALQSRRARADQHLALIAIIDTRQNGHPNDLRLAVLRELQQEGKTEQGEPAMLAWIEQDLREAVVIHKQDATQYFLAGQRLVYQIEPLMAGGQQAKPLWEVARCQRIAGFTVGREMGRTTRLSAPIKVFHYKQYTDRRDSVVRSAYSWGPLWEQEQHTQLADDVGSFHDYLRMTNQLELLFRDAEIFAYERVGFCMEQRREYIAIEERERENPPPRWALRTRGSMTGLFEYVEDLGKEQPTVFLYLGDSEQILIDKHRDEYDKDDWEVIEQSECPERLRQELHETGSPGKEPPQRLFLSRPQSFQMQTDTPESTRCSVPPKGFLRSPELHGQIHLLRRRSVAIAHVRKNQYLLSVLCKPDVYLDTVAPLPAQDALVELDQAKKEAMAALWRTGPLFVLQGPPGSGKTHFVAHLLKQIFAEDPLAQVLVTAQAHGALDVLRQRVRKVLTEGTVEGSSKIFVRSRMPERQFRVEGEAEAADRDYLEQVARKVLLDTRSNLLAKERRTELQNRWLEVVEQLIDQVRDLEIQRTSRNTDDSEKPAQPDGADFVELVKRAASVTFATSTAADLAALVHRTQRFDWVIVEEAGKAHGFDLVLPLQVGYRWLLIGDQRQLEPYRSGDFAKAIAALDGEHGALRRLRSLVKGSSGLVDQALLNDYPVMPRASQADSQNAVSELVKVCDENLRFFERLYGLCDVASRVDRIVSKAPIAAMLYEQHRMHPTLANLISKAYYEPHGRGLGSSAMYKDNSPQSVKASVRHAFGGQIAGHPLVFVDVPRLPNRHEDSGEGYHYATEEADVVARFLAWLHVDPTAQKALAASDEKHAADPLRLAVLTPYRRQMYMLTPRIKQFFSKPPDWLSPAQIHELERDKHARFVHTVDSFQGNQAAVVVVSLVRNNHERDQRPAFGFLIDAPRMNVLLSRAERLLVLVGCWDFFQEVITQSNYNRDDPWAVVMNYLSKHAVRLSSSDLPRLPNLTQSGRPA